MASQTRKRGKSCIYDHPPINGWKFVAGAKAKAKGKGKGKGKGKNNDGAKVPRRFFLEGACKFGDERRQDDSNSGRVAALPAKPKGKAKAKAKAESNRGESQVNK